MLDVVGRYHCMQFKVIIQNQENGKKNNFRPDLGPLGPNSDCQFFFLKNLASSVTRYHGQLSSCIITEKINDPILKEFSDRRTEGQTDE